MARLPRVDDRHVDSFEVSGVTCRDRGAARPRHAAIACQQVRDSACPLAVGGELSSRHRGHRTEEQRFERSAVSSRLNARSSRLRRRPFGKSPETNRARRPETPPATPSRLAGYPILDDDDAGFVRTTRHRIRVEKDHESTLPRSRRTADLREVAGQPQRRKRRAIWLPSFGRHSRRSCTVATEDMPHFASMLRRTPLARPSAFSATSPPNAALQTAPRHSPPSNDITISRTGRGRRSQEKFRSPPVSGGGTDSACPAFYVGRGPGATNRPCCVSNSVPSVAIPRKRDASLGMSWPGGPRRPHTLFAVLA